MARLTALSDSEDIKPAVTTHHRPAKSKRKRDPDSSESDGDGDRPNLSPQLKEKKPRIKKEPTGSKGSGKASAWSKVQVRQLWDALDMKPVSHLVVRHRCGASADVQGKINWDQVSAQVDGRGKIVSPCCEYDERAMPCNGQRADGCQWMQWNGARRGE